MQTLKEDWKSLSKESRRKVLTRIGIGAIVGVIVIVLIILVALNY